jgi:hypothetical protein
MQRFGAQREIAAGAAVGMKDLVLRRLTASERRREGADIASATWRSRDELVAPLVGCSLRSGISAAILRHFGAGGADGPLRDALLQLAPTIVQCFAALDIWAMLPGGGVAAETGGLPDSCYMWRRDGALAKTRR